MKLLQKIPFELLNGPVRIDMGDEPLVAANCRDRLGAGMGARTRIERTEPAGDPERPVVGGHGERRTATGRAWPSTATRERRRETAAHAEGLGRFPKVMVSSSRDVTLPEALSDSPHESAHILGRSCPLSLPPLHCAQPRSVPGSGRSFLLHSSQPGCTRQVGQTIDNIPAKHTPDSRTVEQCRAP